jgi:hypothetical protein
MNKQEEKVYKTAPLPFQGQKRNFVEPFRKALAEFKEKHGVSVVVDLFGGSGLLSHTAKRLYPDIRVVYNDFDNYCLRLKNVNATNVLLYSIRELLKGIPKGARLDNVLTGEILALIEKEAKNGRYVDYITISSSLLFSGKYVLTMEELRKSGMYNNIKQSDYDVSGYLDGLEVARMDYKKLYNIFRSDDRVLFVIDPPYLCTDTKTYSSDKYWRLKDYLDVMRLLESNSYVFFTSNKSSLVELFEWLYANYQVENPFAGSVANSFNATVSYNGKYTDLMYYKNYLRR